LKDRFFVNVGLIVVAAFVTVLAVALGVVAVRSWRDPSMVGDRVPFARMLPFRYRGREAFGRTIGIWAVGMSFIAAFCIVAAFQPSSQGGKIQFSVLARTVELVLIVGWMLSFGAALAVALANVPKILVPPHRRGEGGLAGEWLKDHFHR
jgi:hypothetical protein